MLLQDLLPMSLSFCSSFAAAVDLDLEGSSLNPVPLPLHQKEAAKNVLRCLCLPPPPSLCIFTGRCTHAQGLLFLGFAFSSFAPLSRLLCLFIPLPPPLFSP